MSTDFSSQATPVPQAANFQPVVVGDKYVNGTATATIKTGEGWLAGIFVNSSSAGTLKLYDNTAASGTVICNTFSPVVGWNPCPMHFQKALHAVVGGTLDYTFVYA